MQDKIKWIISEVPKLLENEVLDKETGDKMLKYYNAKLQEEYTKGGVKIFNSISIIGAILIGLGFILLSAYNWNMINREVKVAFAVIPLIGMQGLILFGKIKGYKSFAFTEITATILALLIGASMAIISQAYQIQGDIDTYLKVWMILIIPMVYILRSNMVGFIYYILTLVWTVNSQVQGGSGILFWVFGMLIIPYYYFYVIKKDRFSSSSFFFNFAFVIWILSSVGIALEKAVPGLWIVIYSFIVAIFFFTGVKWFEKSGPFYTIGKYGILFMSYLFTFKFFWQDIGINNFRTEERFNNLGAFSDYIILLILAGYYIYICTKNFKMIKSEMGIFMVLPIVSIVSFLSVDYRNSNILGIILCFNIFTIFTGIFSIYTGIKNKNILETNLGMIIVGLLISTRFLDIQLGFVERAVSFIVLGVVFISTNLFIKKRIGEKYEEKI